MDLDQYLEKMNTNTEFIWIQIILPPIHSILSLLFFFHYYRHLFLGKSSLIKGKFTINPLFMLPWRIIRYLRSYMLTILTTVTTSPSFVLFAIYSLRACSVLIEHYVLSSYYRYYSLYRSYSTPHYVRRRLLATLLYWRSSGLLRRQRATLRRYVVLSVTA